MNLSGINENSMELEGPQMIDKNDILGITEVIRGKLATTPLLPDPSAYDWDGYKGVKLCLPLKAVCNNGLLTLSMGELADMQIRG
jgi:hypothetical protein